MNKKLNFMNRTSPLSSTIFFLILMFFGCTSEPTVEYKYNDNTVRVRLGRKPDRINPVLSYSADARAAYDYVFMEMMDFDPFTLEMTPVIVKSKPEVKVITEGEFAGGNTFSYEIRDEATWDDGSPITGRDVDFTYKLIFSPISSPYRSSFDFVKKVEVDPSNPKKFTVFTDRKNMMAENYISNIHLMQQSHFDPNGALKNYSIAQFNSPQIKELAKVPALKKFAEEFKSSKYSSEPSGVVGCGAYRFVKWETDQYILLERKKDWWGDKVNSSSALLAAYPDSIMLKIIPDQTASLNALKSGEVDVIHSIDSKDFVDYRANTELSKDYELHTPTTSSIFWMIFNTKLPKLSDAKVRRALAHLMDVDDFLENFYYGFGERINGPILNSASYHASDLPLIDYNVGKAKKLLTESGWTDSDNDGFVDKDGNNLELEILIPTSKAAENIAIVFQNNLKKVGINATINKKDGREASKMSKTKDYEIYVGASSLDIGLVDLKQHFHTVNDVPGGSNKSGFGNEKTDALIDQIRETIDETKRNQLYREIQKEIYDWQPAIYLFSPLERLAIHERFEAKTSAKRPTYHVNTFKLKK